MEMRTKLQAARKTEQETENGPATESKNLAARKSRAVNGERADDEIE
jgi:hypothetical protein